MQIIKVQHWILLLHNHHVVFYYCMQVQLLLVHEMPGVGGQEARHGCEFGTFFSCAEGATPEYLLKRGIYSEIAVPLKGGPWREASMALLGDAVTPLCDLLSALEEQADHPSWGRVVTYLLNSGRVAPAQVLKFFLRFS